MIVAIVLAAGESRRMGSPKALLRIGERSFIEQIVSALGETKVGKIIVVLGHGAERIKAEIERLPVTVAVNRDYARGQLSSLIAGLRSLEAERPPEKVDGALVHLVDHPVLHPGLVNRMIDLFYESGKLIVVPVCRGKRGHPVIFSARLFPELLSAPPERGAKAVVRAHGDETLEVETEDRGVVMDIDTPEDYREYLGRK